MDQTYHQKCSLIRENESMGAGLGQSAGCHWLRPMKRKFLRKLAAAYQPGNFWVVVWVGVPGAFWAGLPDTFGGAGWAMPCLSRVGRGTSL